MAGKPRNIEIDGPVGALVTGLISNHRNAVRAEALAAVHRHHRKTIINALVERGMTARQIAELLDVERKTVHTWIEKGR
jgi:DNA-directed RNA polymerase specialized sigma24 family protein